MAALCLLNNEWYGFIYSWADTKKKSNLMLTVLEPGSDVVPWLGNFNNLGPLDAAKTPVSFPVRPTEKRSYTQNAPSWIRQVGLQSDIQKILRHARKLPEKTQNFYKVNYKCQKKKESILYELNDFEIIILYDRIGGKQITTRSSINRLY